MKTLISLDLASQETCADSRCAIRAVFTPSLSQGDANISYVKSFLQQAVYAAHDNDAPMHASLYFSGRAALRLLLNSLQLPKESAIAVQAFTCAAVVLPITSLNLQPLYIDINFSDYSMDFEDLKHKYTKNVKVLILQHSFGITPSRRDEILQFCADRNIILIEDVAHGFIPHKLQTPQNIQNYFALVSFGRSKLISSVFGAGIVTRNVEFTHNLEKVEMDLPNAPKLLNLRCLLYKIITPFIKQTYSITLGRLLHRFCIMVDIFPREISSTEKRGAYDSQYEYGYSEILAYTLKEQIGRLPKLLKTIETAVGEYRNNLPNLPSLPSTPLNRFPYLLPESANRSDILRHFKKLGILLGTWYNEPVGPEKVDLAQVQYVRGSCPNAENISRRIINLPTNVELNIVRDITHAIKTFTSA